uniref:Transferrin n=1 Tax=Cacopsylla melanoneura TaxID=428564 RepID=A0A8D8XPF4_9HEMI
MRYYRPGLYFSVFLIISCYVQYSLCLLKDYKICVPDQYMAECKRMVEVGAATGGSIKLQCIGARDRVDCIDQLQNKVADFTFMEPEDMYIISKKFDENFIIFKEVRTKVEPTSEFRYEAVAVVKNDLNLKNLQSIKGLKSCHTGVGRNVGYKIPLTKLKNYGVLGNVNDETKSPRENELKAFSQLFSKACIVGQWSPDPKVNEAWKKKYSNLCDLCEDPAKCDYPDKNSGYEGALNCLTGKNGGDIAWTKIKFVKEYFGLTPDFKAKAPKEQYSFLCPDGKTVPLTETPCTWAARPWPGFVANNGIETNTQDLTQLRNYISELNKLGESSGADWLTHVLGIDGNTTAVDNKETQTPKQYLVKANYEDVIGRVVKPIKPIRWCVWSQEGMSKCLAFKDAAFSRDIRPPFECIREESSKVCLKQIGDGAADVITLDATAAILARKNQNMRPILKEQYGNEKDLLAVAVVNKNSKVKNFEDLKGLRSCHTAYMRTTGWVAPVYNLLENKLIKTDQCPYTKGVAEFFSGGSCVPGIKDEEKDAPESLEKICPKDTHVTYTPLQCLKSGDGDVAFIKQVKVNEAIEEGLFKPDEIEYVCSKTGRAPITKAAECNLGVVPPHMVITSNSKSNVEINTIKHAILSAANLFSKRPEVFKLFGSFMGKPDVLFMNPATSVEVLPEQPTELENNYYAGMLTKVMSCSDKKTNNV